LERRQTFSKVDQNKIDVAVDSLLREAQRELGIKEK
jgi:hypothetical protein